MLLKSFPRDVRRTLSACFFLLGAMAACGHDIAIPPDQGFAEAVKAVAEFRRANPDYDKPVVVTFAPGTRYLERAAFVGRDVSGSIGSPTVFRASAEGDVVFSGGVAVTNWTVGADGVWTAPIALGDFLGEDLTRIPLTRERAAKIRKSYFDDVNDLPTAEACEERIQGFNLSSNDYPFTQLFVNDQRRFRPRYPGKGYFRMAGQLDPLDGKPERGDHRFLWDPKDDLRTSFRNSGDVDVLAFLIQSMHRTPLGSVSKGADPSNCVVNVAGRSCGGWGRYKKDYPYCFENVYEEFKKPGQWYWDRRTAHLLYRPMPGETPETVHVVLPRLTRLLIACNARHVRFEGIQFAHAAFRRPKYGHINPQGELYSYAAVYLWGGQFNSFRACCFRNTGAYALCFTRSATDNAAEGCEFFDIGAGCVKVLGDRNAVRNCDLGHFGRVQPGGTGVMVHIANNVHVEDCNIHDAYYMGVNVGYSFGYRHPGAAHDNVVSRNHIWHLGAHLLADQGGVYVVGVNEGTVVADNLIHDITARLYGGWGLYTDEGATGVRMTGNVVHHTRHAGFHQHFGRDNLIANNIFAECGEKQSVIAVTRVDQPYSFVFRNNVLAWSGRQEAYNNAGKWKPGFFAADRNYFHNGTNRAVYADGWLKRGFDVHSTVGEDPCFVDPAGGDYRLRPDSPVYKAIAFKPVLAQRPGKRTPNVFAPRFPPVPPAFEAPE